MTRIYARPILVSRTNTRCELQRIHLGAGTHDEAWLQALIHDHPAILPIADIEPGFGDPLPAAREVPCGHGFIDNLYLTPAGDIVLVEAKLWRNSQMRREVVAQVLDYVAALTKMGYEGFEAAIRRGNGAPERLFDLVRDHPEALSEAAFIDAVSNNLRRGRMLAVALGDGIRTETEALAQFLQSHAGAHFTFALVELSVWRNATGDLLVVPSTLARTVMIERGIVRLEHGAVSVHPVPQEEQLGPQSLSSSDFWEAIGRRDPRLPGVLHDFLAALEPLGVYPDLKASLNLKADLPDRPKPINLGYITKNGQLWTNPAAWETPEYVWRPYMEKLAGLIGGTIATGSTNYVSIDGKSAPRIEQFLPAHQAAFLQVVADMLRALAERNAVEAGMPSRFIWQEGDVVVE